MVYRTGEHLSSAIILENLTNVNIGDTVSEPGRDLNNMSDDKPHVRNEPQDSHDTEHNQYNIHSNINKFDGLLAKTSSENFRRRFYKNLNKQRRTVIPTQS